MKISVGSFNIEIMRHAIVATELGIAGYVEGRLPDGREVRFCGRWDNPYNVTIADEERPDSIAHIGELVWVDGVLQENEDENSFSFILDKEREDGITAEDLANQIYETSSGTAG